jgi:hypothetical protein
LKLWSWNWFCEEGTKGDLQGGSKIINHDLAKYLISKNLGSEAHGSWSFFLGYSNPINLMQPRKRFSTHNHISNIYKHTETNPI